MFTPLRRVLSGEGLAKRAARSAGLTVVSQAGTAAIRFGANLILTRLLFPEAFGLMVIVNVFIIALQLFSDVGINVSIIRSPRGEEPAYLKTAYVLQILRGALLAVIVVGAAPHIAQVYDEPLLAALLQVTAIAVFVEGFMSVNVSLAQRHLRIGRVVALEIAGLLLNVTSAILIAHLTGSIWSLVAGLVIGRSARTVASHFALPGPKPGFAWEPNAARDILSFGAFIFLSGAATFVAKNAAAVSISLFVTTATLGVFSIARTAAELPLNFLGAITGRVLLPAYAERSPLEDANARTKHALLRRVVQASFAGVMFLLASVAVPLVEFLYDERYALAGPTLMLMTCLSFTSLLTVGYVASASARGDGRGQFLMNLALAVACASLSFAGVSLFGLGGAIAGSALGPVLAYPVFVHHARRAGSFDPVGDWVLLILGVCIAGVLISVNSAALSPLFIESSL